MKFSNLVYEGFSGKSGSIDLTQKALGIFIVPEADAMHLKNLLSFALYGDIEEINSHLLVTLKFSHENVDYTLTREITPVAGEFLFSADIVDGTTDKIITSDVEATNAFILKCLNLTKLAFLELFYVAKDEVVKAFLENDEKRQEYVLEKLSRIEDFEKVDVRYKALLEEQAEFLKILDEIDPVTKAMLKEDTLKTEAYKEELDSSVKQIYETYEDMLRVKQYDENTTKYFEENAKLEKLKQNMVSLEANYIKAKNSRLVKEIADIFNKCKNIEKDIDSNLLEVSTKEAKLSQLTAKYDAAKQSAENSQNIFINDEQKTDLLKNKLAEFITVTSKNPRDYKIYDRINSFYVESDKEIARLELENQNLEKDIEGYTQSLSLLTTQKSQLKLDAAYKKDVQNAAVLEGNLTGLLDDIKNSEERIANYEQEKNRLSSESKRLLRVNLELKKTKEDLIKKIKGGHQSIKDAVNADTLYKQTIYSRHLIVSANEVELHAVSEKIGSVKTANAKYRVKLEEAEAKKKKVEEHLSVIMDRFTLLNSKKNEYESFNRMRDISDNIVLGSHCPVCDGFVTVKKELQEKNTKDLDAQIKAVNQEIARCNLAVNEVNTLIGQYQSAYKTSIQYAESLEATLLEKKKIIGQILNEYKAETIPHLFRMVADAANDSKLMTANLDKLSEVEAELRKESEAALIINERLTKLESEILPKENARLNGLLADYEKKTIAYDALQHTLNGESGEQLLLKIQVLEKEYQTLEDEIEEKSNKLKAVKAKYDENNMLIAILRARRLSIKDGKEELSYEQLIVRTVMRDLNNLVEEMGTIAEDREETKLKLSAILKIQSRTKEEIDELKREIEGLNAKIASKRQILEDLLLTYGKKFEQTGLKDKGIIDSLILSDEKTLQYENEYNENQESIIKTNQTIADLTLSLEANQPYKDVQNEISEHLNELKAKEFKNILQYNEALKVLEMNQAKYDIISAAKLKLSFIEAKIKGIEELSSTIINSKIDNKAFTEFIINNANSKIKNWTGGNCYLEINDNTVSLTNMQKTKTLPTFNLSEKALVDYALAISANESFKKLMATDLLSFIPLSDEDVSKTTIQTLVDASKENDIVIVTADENAIFKVVSKL